MQSLSSTPYPVEVRLLSGVRITDQVRNDKDKNHRSSKDLIMDNRNDFSRNGINEISEMKFKKAGRRAEWI